ncbi:MAG: N-acetyltransferase [Saprospiraceae bacterium]|nr:N-acetyltransferase [Saprospiraceae bacterium]
MKLDGRFIKVVNNEENSRFEVRIGMQLARIDYRLREGKIYFLHTEVPDDLKGQGIASKMAKRALEYAEKEQLEVVAWCPFVAAYIKRQQG